MSATGSLAAVGSSAIATPETAGPTPSASDGQNRRRYRLIVSATSCPTVRVSGGSGGGNAWDFAIPLRATRAYAAAGSAARTFSKTSSPSRAST